MMDRLQLTLAILKPHVVKNPIFVQRIRDIILSSAFKIVRSKRSQITLSQAEEFYGEHKKRFFYNRLITMITSGPSDILIMARPNAIQHWRNLMGPTQFFRAQFEAPESIRAQFGLSDTRNATHGSDSPESARREIRLFFKDFDYDDWFLKEEMHFREENVHFLADIFVHRINNDEETPT